MPMGSIRIPTVADLPRTVDLVIIGGGIIGAATAFFATRAGIRTVVFERRKALGTLTTAASSQCFRAQFTEPENIAQMKESIAIFERFGEFIGIPEIDIQLHQQGYLFLADDEAGAAALRTRVEWQRANGLPDVEYLDADEVRYRFPYVAPIVTGAAFRAGDGWLSAHEVTYGFAKASAADFFVETPVTGLLTQGQRVHGVQTPLGNVTAGTVVLAAGPYTARVAALAGVELPLWPLRRHKAVVGADPRIPHWAPMTIDTRTGVHWRPEHRGGMLMWGEPEPYSEPTDDVPVDWSFAARAIDGMARLCPFWADIANDLTRDRVFVQAGQYTMSPDGKPIIGPVSGWSGLYVHAGYSGHGIMGAPAGARLLVDLITGRADPNRNPYAHERLLGRQEIPREQLVL